MFYSGNAWLNPVGENLQKVAFNGHAIGEGAGGLMPIIFVLCRLEEIGYLFC